MEKNLYPEIPQEKFAFIHKDERIHDEKLQTKSISYLGDAWLRFRKNKSSVVAFCLIVFLLLFAIITPFASPYTVQFRDGYYKSMLPSHPPACPSAVPQRCHNRACPLPAAAC